MAKTDKASKEAGKLRVTLVKSTIACSQKQIKTAEALGVKKIGQVNLVPNNPCTQGMIEIIKHLVTVEKV